MTFIHYIFVDLHFAAETFGKNYAALNITVAFSVFSRRNSVYSLKTVAERIHIRKSALNSNIRNFAGRVYKKNFCYVTDASAYKQSIFISL